MVVVACGDDSINGPPTAVLGTGDTVYESLSAGDDIFVIQGPQGGFHVLGSVRASGIEPGDSENLQSSSNPTTEFRVFSGAQRIDAMASRYVQGLDPIAGDDRFEMLGRLVILDIQNDDQLDGVAIRIEVEIVDVDGRRATDTQDVTAVPHPQNL